MTDRINELRIEPISKAHNRTDFSCAKPSFSEYLQRFARKNDERNIAKTFVAVDGDRVYGYYSLSATSIEFEELPEEHAKQLPGYPVPASLIGQLAVDSSIEGQGLGPRLLVDALQKIVSVSEEMAIKVVIVDAIDADAKSFYQHFGFLELPGHDLKLFLPIETIRKAVNSE
jgi:predicted N-acetyltransferase YhbS